MTNTFQNAKVALHAPMREEGDSCRLLKQFELNSSKLEDRCIEAVADLIVGAKGRSNE